MLQQTYGRGVRLPETPDSDSSKVSTTPKAISSVISAEVPPERFLQFSTDFNQVTVGYALELRSSFRLMRVLGFLLRVLRATDFPRFFPVTGRLNEGGGKATPIWR